MTRIQTENKEKNLEVIAVNVFSHIPLDYWESYWKSVGGGEAIFAIDPNREAIQTLKIHTAGSTVIIDKNGHIVFQDRVATSYDILREAVEKAP